MRSSVYISFATVLFNVAVGTAEDDTPKPELKVALQVVQRSLDKFAPAAKVEFDGSQTVKIMHLPQTFKIHGVSKGGEVALEAHDEIGPSARGFILTLHVQPKGEVNQAVTPQTLRRPYWMTDLDVTPIAKSDQQIYWGLSYGARTDAKLLEDLRAKLRALKD
jgi:hypothetical protein